MADEIYARPQLYESLYSDFNEDVNWLLSCKNISLSGAVLELASGGGRILGGLAKRSSSTRNELLYGIDIDPGMIALAQNRYPSINWIKGDILENVEASIPYIESNLVLLMANSLAHFSARSERDQLYCTIKQLLKNGGAGVIAVLTEESFVDSQQGPVHVGSCTAANGEKYEVYEQSRPATNNTQRVEWFFVSDDGEGDFKNTFNLARFTRGQIGEELLSTGANIIERAQSFDSCAAEENFWDIYVYRY